MDPAGSPQAVLAYITCATGDEAERIGRALVGERLAGCVNILPGMRSLVWWEGVLTASAEVVLIAKTTASQAPSLSARVRELHSYSCPCVVVMPVIGGNPAYLAWLAGEVRGDEAGQGGGGVSAEADRQGPPTDAPPAE